MKKLAHPPDFYTGSPIDPEDLWFREEFIEQLWDTLSAVAVS